MKANKLANNERQIGLLVGFSAIPWVDETSASFHIPRVWAHSPGAGSATCRATSTRVEIQKSALETPYCAVFHRSPSVCCEIPSTVYPLDDGMYNDSGP